MALTVEKLNDDTTFLLAFAPPFAPTRAARIFPGAFTILVDPWLVGPSSILHPTFQRSRHTTDCAISSLTALPEPPDLIIISQDKPDHCHRETLCTLPRDTHTRILATPAAAKKIRAWKYFDSSIVHIMHPYCPDSSDALIRIALPSYTSSSTPGEITIANLPAKRDITKLHNAIGITYRPPGSLLTTLGGELGALSDPRNPHVIPKLHKACSAVQLADASGASASLVRPQTASAATRPAFFDSCSPPNLHEARSATHPPHAASPIRPHTAGLATRPAFIEPLGRTQSSPTAPIEPTRADSKLDHRPPKPRTRTEKTISILYTPHGVSFNTVSQYLHHHLQHASGGAPLTALFHSMNVEQNPWFMGGTVANGAPGGAALARKLRARHWISAHDEAKANTGVATTWIKSRRYGLDEVQKLLDAADDVGEGETAVWMLSVGESMRIDG